MPTMRTDKCDGCTDRDEAACMCICLHGLMRLDKEGSVAGHVMKAYNQESKQCWECYASLKICPRNAIECRHYADVVPRDASVHPLHGADSIIWIIKFRTGNKKRFEFPIRATPEGSADPYGGENDALLEEIADHNFLFTRTGRLRAGGLSV